MDSDLSLRSITNMHLTSDNCCHEPVYCGNHSLTTARGQITLCGAICLLTAAGVHAGRGFNQLAALAGDKNEALDAIYYYQRR